MQTHVQWAGGSSARRFGCGGRGGGRAMFNSKMAGQRVSDSLRLEASHFSTVTLQSAAPWTRLPPRVRQEVTHALSSGRLYPTNLLDEASQPLFLISGAGGAPSDSHPSSCRPHPRKASAWPDALAAAHAVDVSESLEELIVGHFVPGLDLQELLELVRI